MKLFISVFMLVAISCVKVKAQHAGSHYKTEIFDQAVNGKQKIDLSFHHRNSKFNLVDKVNKSQTSEATRSLNFVNLDYGYGISESMAIHMIWGYAFGREREQNLSDSSLSSEYSILGFRDLDIRFSGNHYSEDSLLHWRIQVEYDLGDRTLKQTRLGPPAKYESNAFSGRTTLNLQFGYAHQVGPGYLGLTAKADVVKNKADFYNTNINGVRDKLATNGGQAYSGQLFYELPGDKILWGGALGVFEINRFTSEFQGSVVSAMAEQRFYQLLLFSRLDTGPGHELYVGFGYDFYSRTGGTGPVSYFIEDGSGFFVTTTYAVEF